MDGESTVDNEFDQYVNFDEVGAVIPLEENAENHRDSDEEGDEFDGASQSVDDDGDDQSNHPELMDSKCVFASHLDSVYATACSSHFAVSGDGADRAYLWNVSSGALVHELVGHSDSVTSCDFSFDGSEVLTGSMDGSVKIWRVEDGSEKFSLNDSSGDIEIARFHPSGPALVIGDSEGLVWLYSSQSGQLMHTMSGHEGAVSVAQWTSDGKMIVSGDSSGGAIAWLAKTATAAFKFPKLHTESAITALATAPFAQRLAITGAEDGSIALINCDNGRTMHRVLEGHALSVEAVSFGSLDSKLAATGGVDGQMHVWDLTTGQRRLSAEHSDAITGLFFHATQPIIYTSCADGNLRAWDARTGELAFIRHGHSAPILTMSINKEQTLIVTGSDDYNCRVFDARVAV